MSLSKRDLEDLKPAVDETLRHVLGFSDSAVVTAALNCVAKGMSKSKAIDMLTPLLEESAPRFVESLFATISQKQAALKTKKRSAVKDEDPGRPKRKRLSHFTDDEEDEKYVPAMDDAGQLSSSQIKNMMEAARQQIIAGRTQRSGLPSGRKVPQLLLHQPNTSLLSLNPTLVNDAMQKVQKPQRYRPVSRPLWRALDLTSKQLPSLYSLKSLPAQGRRWEACGFGCANIRAKRREEFKATQQEKPQDINPILPNFLTHGSLSGTETPTVEWWDSVILQSDSYDDIQEGAHGSDRKSEDKFTGITYLVEHPIQMQPPAEPTKPVEIPIYLTKKEQKKLRRQRRRETQREQSEKIRLGLEPPPEPKVRMANLMRVLGTEAVQDPTKVEAHVRAQMEKRQK
ncbi:putative U4/U6 small nuclear ribonucleoprotein Prp3 [Apostichopus japonicus]|uniref:Putative U4/U6 small nuclear ribonucleoprotein Prp3 n=1 Tax=Stichopus japonicus TaxID=307972 RepID=A0A2G8L3W5_STIJA|nr:putative U4/U6 small nuclear ribonucleoprotein Prp3 [Apostichopus japonicus]